jgi:hypothetical protein
MIFSSASARAGCDRLAFNRDQCDVPCALDEFDFGVRGVSAARRSRDSPGAHEVLHPCAVTRFAVVISAARIIRIIGEP